MRKPARHAPRNVGLQDLTLILLRPRGLRRETRDSLAVLLLAERARSEGARSTRAFEDRPDRPWRDRGGECERNAFEMCQARCAQLKIIQSPSLRENERAWKEKAGGSPPPFVLAEGARSECAPSTRAVNGSRATPYQRETSKPGGAVK